MTADYVSGVEAFARRHGLSLATCNSSGLYDAANRQVSATFHKYPGGVDLAKLSVMAKAFYKAVADVEVATGKKFSMLTSELAAPLQIHYIGYELPAKLADVYEVLFFTGA